MEPPQCKTISDALICAASSRLSGGEALRRSDTIVFLGRFWLQIRVQNGFVRWFCTRATWGFRRVKTTVLFMTALQL